MSNTSSSYKAVLSSGGYVMSYQFPPTNYPIDTDPVTRVTSAECPCIGITTPSTGTGTTGSPGITLVNVVGLSTTSYPNPSTW